MEPDDSYHDCLNNLDEHPKDLTTKTAKKMKPIPPPLNLNTDKSSEPVSMTVLKEFASFATSPKSPLMVKHLPFRKRAHIISAKVSLDMNNDEPVRSSITENSNDIDKSGTVQSGNSSPKISSETNCDSLLNGISSKYNNNSCSVQRIRSPLDNSDRKQGSKLTSSNVSFYQGCKNRPLVNNISAVCEREKLSFDEEDYVLDLSTHQNSSVLLSPTPSSLGSSREELAVDSTRSSGSSLYQTRLWGLPWPPPLWHCFQSGSKLNIGSSSWCSVEELGPCPPDWPAELIVDRLSILESSVIIGFISPNLLNDVKAEVSRAHAFLVKDRGWTAVCGESLFSKFSVRCPSLQLGDIVMLPTIHRLPLPLPLPSPDICERIKRFSFPPPDDPQSPQMLSPPTTPTRKNQDCDKPKRPMNAFMLFAKRFRLELIQSHPGKDNRAISVILGEVWRTLPQEEREIYIRGARDLSEEQKLLHPDCWKRKRSHSTS